MRILVTGGAGYIGSITTRVLLDAGHECVVLDTLERGHREAVDPRARVRRQGSVGDRAALGRGAAGLRRGHAPRRLHRGRRVGRRAREVLPRQRHRAARHARRDGASTVSTRIVFSSTAAVYGEPESVPIPEDAPHHAGQPVRREQARLRGGARRVPRRARHPVHSLPLLQRRRCVAGRVDGGGPRS